MLNVYPVKCRSSGYFTGATSAPTSDLCPLPHPASFPDSAFRIPTPSPPLARRSLGEGRSALQGRDLTPPPLKGAIHPGPRNALGSSAKNDIPSAESAIHRPLPQPPRVPDPLPPAPPGPATPGGLPEFSRCVVQGGRGRPPERRDLERGAPPQAVPEAGYRRRPPRRPERGRVSEAAAGAHSRSPAPPAWPSRPRNRGGPLRRKDPTLGPSPAAHLPEQLPDRDAVNLREPQYFLRPASLPVRSDTSGSCAESPSCATLPLGLRFPSPCRESEARLRNDCAASWVSDPCRPRVLAPPASADVLTMYRQHHKDVFACQFRRITLQVSVTELEAVRLIKGISPSARAASKVRPAPAIQTDPGNAPPASDVRA